MAAKPMLRAPCSAATCCCLQDVAVGSYTIVVGAGPAHPDSCLVLNMTASIQAGSTSGDHQQPGGSCQGGSQGEAASPSLLSELAAT